MPRGLQEPTFPVVTLQRLIDAGADVQRIAHASVMLWRGIDNNLFAVIGQRGVSVLYQRTLSQTASQFPWMTCLYGGLQADMDLAALQSLLGAQSSPEAAAGSKALFQNFHGRLSGMIGPALTERLLCMSTPETVIG